MNEKVETLKSSAMVYMRNVGPYGSSDNFKRMIAFKNWIADNDLQKELETNGILGIALDNPANTLPEDCRYDLILCVSNRKKFNSEVTMGQFEGGKYAVFVIPHTKEAVQQFWANLENNSDINKLRVRERPIIERFKEEEGTCEFLIPVE